MQKIMNLRLRNTLIIVLIFVWGLILQVPIFIFIFSSDSNMPWVYRHFSIYYIFLLVFACSFYLRLLTYLTIKPYEWKWMCLASFYLLFSYYSSDLFDDINKSLQKVAINRGEQPIVISIANEIVISLIPVFLVIIRHFFVRFQRIEKIINELKEGNTDKDKIKEG